MKADANRKHEAHAASAPRKADGSSNFLTGFSQLLKALALVVLIGWALHDRDFVEDWLFSLSGGELFGFKFQRETIDQATNDLQRLAKSSEDSFDEKLAQVAIVRASRVAPAIVESRILWVDDGWSKSKPNNPFNNTIVGILEKLKISVVTASSTKEATDAMQITPFDIIISNVWRPADTENLKRPLSMCKVHYFDFPNSEEANKFIKPVDVVLSGYERAREIALTEFNKEANAHAAAGFVLAESIFAAPSTDRIRPNVILFAAATARVARSLCDYTITNRGDVLLNAVVSALEKKHANLLVRRHVNNNDQPTSNDKATP
ncbi:hypothetical protein [Bradyrhizobium sp. Ec3.3]|uniref:hypothetical protein n=1 Tax=Bradyrhizobium sp. Ec3.3 TaxID=189753 RepID=UPI0012EBA642|nr:hypothetical protein [Bradyrhizobium sp. Ec3.3]